MAIYHMSAKMLSRSSRNTVNAAAYRTGCKLVDEQTGRSFDFSNKPVQHVELLLPEGAPQWAQDLQKLISDDRRQGVQQFSDLAEAAEKRKDSQVYRELEFALPQEFTDEQNFALAREFLEDQCCRLGIAALANFHLDVDEETGEYKPHCHALLLTRRLEERGFSLHKEAAWNTKAQLLQWREQWAAYTNFHLKLNGFEARIDHRSNKDRGIDLEGQPKIGKGVKETERRLQEQGKQASKDKSGKDGREGAAGKPVPILDKIRAFQEVKLKNLYRIIRRPEVVLEIAGKNQATFMWGDVQRILARYVDDATLFQKLEAKLRNSRELVFLRTVHVDSAPKAALNAPREIAYETAVYTTRTMLKAELNLVRIGERLGEAQSHPVKEPHVAKIIAAYDRELAVYGGLSSDQKAAVLHLTKRDQLSCVVGYAGAGKTTVLKAAKEIWEAEGYRVYGLAPTGKASQNLERLGIQSKTLHKFLKEFEGGRSRYSSKSILMLDEAGMVDAERFEGFLKAVDVLGVKAVIVGDGAQLQPVEAGASLRLVTERIGAAKLETIVRQKEDWQREATQLFGRLKTREAIEAYYKKACIEFVEEKVPDLITLKDNNDHRGAVELYNLSRRVAGNIYHSMIEDLKERGLSYSQSGETLSSHQDYGLYRQWKIRREGAAAYLHDNLDACKPFMKELGVDPQAFALWFVDRSSPKREQLEDAKALEIKWGLPQLDEYQDRHVCDVKAAAKQKTIEAFLTSFKADPEKSHLIFAYTNKDVRGMNEEVRASLKQEGKIDKEDYLYTIHRRDETDFNDPIVFKEERRFAVGDRLLFTRNDNSLGVSNGTLGTVRSLNRQRIQVQLDGRDKTVSFAPRLYPYFDQGWAATIHKTQGADADKCFLLASREMYRNLAYVGMTRHKESLKVFGSRLDFWRDEIFMGKLSSMNEKLMGIDYVSSDQAYALMKQDDRLLTKIFKRVGDELEAIKYVSKRGWQEVCSHFIGEKMEASIAFPTEDSLSEAERAKLLWAEKEMEGVQEAGIGSEIDGKVGHDSFAEIAALASFNATHSQAKSPNQEGAAIERGRDAAHASPENGAVSPLQAKSRRNKPRALETMSAHSVDHSQGKNLPRGEGDKRLDAKKPINIQGEELSSQPKDQRFKDIERSEEGLLKQVLNMNVIHANKADDGFKGELDQEGAQKVKHDAKIQTSPENVSGSPAPASSGKTPVLGDAPKQPSPAQKAEAAPLHVQEHSLETLEKVNGGRPDRGQLNQAYQERITGKFKERVGRSPLKSELKDLHLIAARTAEAGMIFHEKHHRFPEEKDIRILSARSQHELSRLKGVSQSLSQTWKAEHFSPRSRKPIPIGEYLSLKMNAERIADIEGRKLAEHMKVGGKADLAPETFYEQARKELAANQRAEQKLSGAYQRNLKLTPECAARLAEQVMRFEERHGYAPSQQRLDIMHKIAEHQASRMEHLQAAYQKWSQSNSKGVPSVEELKKERQIYAYALRREGQALEKHYELHKEAPNPEQLKQIRNDAVRDYLKIEGQYKDEHKRSEEKALKSAQKERDDHEMER